MHVNGHVQYLMIKINVHFFNHQVLQYDTSVKFDDNKSIYLPA